MAKQTFNDSAAQDTSAAKYLDAFVDHRECGLAGVQLRHGSRPRFVFAATIVLPGRKHMERLLKYDTLRGTFESEGGYTIFHPQPCVALIWRFSSVSPAGVQLARCRRPVWRCLANKSQEANSPPTPN
jgi:hypothetical protein